jgi:hypothetical protein
VLAEVDTTELRRSVVEAVPDPYDTRNVYRFGDPRVRSDLVTAEVNEARGVIVLPERDGADVSVVQTVLALNAELGGLDELPVRGRSERSNDCRAADARMQPDDAPDRRIDHRNG